MVGPPCTPWLLTPTARGGSGCAAASLRAASFKGTSVGGRRSALQNVGVPQRRLPLAGAPGSMSRQSVDGIAACWRGVALAVAFLGRQVSCGDVDATALQIEAPRYFITNEQGEIVRFIGAEVSTPADCQTPEWDHLRWLMSVACAGDICVDHPVMQETAIGFLMSKLRPELRDPCIAGIAALAVIIMRRLASRSTPRDHSLVSDVLGTGPGAVVTLRLGNDLGLAMPLNYRFEPFPYGSTDLLPFRRLTQEAVQLLYATASSVLSEETIPHLPWLGTLRFWSARVVAMRESLRFVTEVARAEIDMLVPLDFEDKLLALHSAFAERGKRDPLQRLFMRRVHAGRLTQISMNSYGELGDGMDSRHICPSCLTLNVFFFRREDLSGPGFFQPSLALTTEKPPCWVAAEDVFPLQRLGDIRGFPTEWIGADFFASKRALEQLVAHATDYFGRAKTVPCWMQWYEDPDLKPVEKQRFLGPVHSLLVSNPRTNKEADERMHMLFEYAAAEPRDGSGPDDPLVALEGRGDGSHAASSERQVLGAADFSEGIEELRGVSGWFEYIERRLRAQSPGMIIFNQKVMMKKLMTERGAPIPHMYYASLDTPVLPFKGPELPLFQGGYAVKPAHLAESSNVFAILEDGTDIMTGALPTLEEVQGNISFAWSRSLRDYDTDSGCAKSQVHASLTEGRSCVNWALYHAPPGFLVEKLAVPSPLYDDLRKIVLTQQDITIRGPPDEIKCHVVWGRLFAAEWVAPKLVLGIVFRHGFVKDNIIMSPGLMKACWQDEHSSAKRSADLGDRCYFYDFWTQVVAVAERAVPAGVDYMRVDIFPNGLQPVVNELATAGYSTLLDDWMLEEMLRRVQEGYFLRGVGNWTTPDI